MTPVEDSLATAFFAEILAVDQQAKTLLARGLPKGMELSQFVVLNHLAHLMAERTPAQLAQTFHVTRGAMTNTLGRLEGAGYVHIRPGATGTTPGASWWSSARPDARRATRRWRR